MPPQILTDQEAAELDAIAGGADISCPQIARALRDIERTKPWAIEICPPMGRYSGRGHVPYFGAISTPAGKRAVARNRAAVTA